MKSIYMPHDKFVRAAFKNTTVAREFIERYLPIVIQSELDLTKLELSSETHIDEKLAVYISDIVFTCPYKEPINGVEYANIPILIEHQSSADSLIALRVHHYLINFVYSELKRNSAAKASAAYALVLYHGEPTPYPYSLDLIDCFEDPHGIMSHYFNNPVQLIDVGQIADDDLSKQKLAGVMQGALKYSRASEPEKKLIKLLIQLSKLDFASEQELKLASRLITNYFFSVVDSVNPDNVIAAGIELPIKLRGEYMTIAEGLEAKGKAEGKAEGKIEGQREVALNALNKGYAIETIVDLTGLDIDVVEQLQRQLED